MREFAAESGVPAPTIKHYLREGLLPEPHRTGRNMAYYDAALIPRVRRIKHLQKRLFLPLNVIKEVLDAQGEQVSDADIALERSIAAVLKDGTTAKALMRSRAEEQGATPHELDLFAKLGLLQPKDLEGETYYEGDDIEFLNLLASARQAGLREDMLPPTILVEYAQAISNLVRLELTMFREGVLPKAGDDLSRLAATATGLSERLVVILRRKLLLPTLRELIAEHAEAKED
jgi:DNA-binding transcriptional MerR regulator